MAKMDTASEPYRQHWYIFSITKNLKINRKLHGWQEPMVAHFSSMLGLYQMLYPDRVLTFLIEASSPYHSVPDFTFCIAA